MVTSTLRSTSRLALAGLAILAAALRRLQGQRAGVRRDRRAGGPSAGGARQPRRPHLQVHPGAPTPPPLGNRKVFVHFLDADDEQMWTDDHDPPTPTAAWKPGQTVEYTRTMFVPVYPYVGEAKIVAGLYDPSSGERVRFSGTERGGRAYEVAQIELLPQTENVFLIYKDGWHSVETAQDNSLVEWQWTRKEATFSFRNPRRDSRPLPAGRQPGQECRRGDRHRGAHRRPGRGDDPGEGRRRTGAAAAADAPPSSAAGDMVELKLVADKTFVPALEPGSGNADSRELGARVFHAFVQPRGRSRMPTVAAAPAASAAVLAVVVGALAARRRPARVGAAPTSSRWPTAADCRSTRFALRATTRC